MGQSLFLAGGYTRRAGLACALVAVVLTVLGILRAIASNLRMRNHLQSAEFLWLWSAQTSCSAAGSPSTASAGPMFIEFQSLRVAWTRERPIQMRLP